MKELWVVTNHENASAKGLIHKAEELAEERDLKLKPISFSQNSPEEQADVIEILLSQYKQSKPEVILFACSRFFSDVAPAFAARIRKGITADCTELKWHEDYGLLQIRPTYGGRKIAVNRSLSVPYIATIREGVFGTDTEKDAEEETLYTARVILAGGLGLKSRDGFKKLEFLANCAHAQLGASRAAVAAGYAPYSCQVGQTGATVRPDVYIAFGISGAVQHLSGILAARQIVAVNNDPKAPIHDYADYSLIADVNEVIELLIEKFKKRREAEEFMRQIGETIAWK